LPTVFPEARARADRLARRTSLGVGGAPEFLFEPDSEAAAARVLALCHHVGVPVHVLGGGTNLIVSDAGVAGAVIATHRLRGLRVHPDRVEVGAGHGFAQLARRAARWRIPGLSGCPGIPGTVGGAVRMNAGGRHGSAGEALIVVRGLDMRGRTHCRTVSSADLGYRTTSFADLLITRASFRRDPSLDRKAAERLYRRALEEKRRTQPLGARSAGCMFRNPPRGEPAGRLIEAAGLKGRRVGGAVVSALHANFILNEGGATASDVQELARLVQREVRACSGVELELEPHLWG
jgi:UDP-N-acetylmuramate dehydrogenase